MTRGKLQGTWHSRKAKSTERILDYRTFFEEVKNGYEQEDLATVAELWGMARKGLYNGEDVFGALHSFTTDHRLAIPPGRYGAVSMLLILVEAFLADGRTDEAVAALDRADLVVDESTPSSVRRTLKALTERVGDTGDEPWTRIEKIATKSGTLRETARRILDALPSTTLEQLAVECGLTPDTVRSLSAALQQGGLMKKTTQGWEATPTAEKALQA